MEAALAFAALAALCAVVLYRLGRRPQSPMTAPITPELLR